MISEQNFKKGHNAIKKAGRVMYLILCTYSNHPIMVYVCTKFRENVLYVFGVME